MIYKESLRILIVFSSLCLSRSDVFDVILPLVAVHRCHLRVLCRAAAEVVCSIVDLA
jgi:hypothetical protein